MKLIYAIFRKEIVDVMRDRRTLMMVSFSALLFVPLMLVIFSVVMSQLESQVEKRSVLALNISQAPGLENYMLRQGYKVEAAPADYEKKLSSKDLNQPVLLIPENFEQDLSEAKKVRLVLVFDSSNQQIEFALRPLRSLLDGYLQETAMRHLSMRGVAPELLGLIELKEQHLGNPNQRRVNITGMLPFALIMAIVIGGMFAAIDLTAGERERGSLEPLMMNPLSGWHLALGKWSAVASVSMLVALLTVLSFFPSQWLIKNDALRAEFQFGVYDGVNFLLILLPLAACISAMQVALSLTCKSFKEAQVRNQILSMGISLAPMLLMFNSGREPAWFLWIPSIAQSLMMNQVLKGENLGLNAMLIALLVCLSLTLASLWYVSQKIRKVVVM